MKKLSILAGLFLMVPAILVAQSKEIKKASKAVDKGNIEEAIGYLNDAESLLGSAEKDDKVTFYVVKAKAYTADAGKSNFDKMKVAAESLLKVQELGGSSKLEKEISDAKQNLRVALVNSAIDDQNAKNYNRASEKLYLL